MTKATVAAVTLAGAFTAISQVAATPASAAGPCYEVTVYYPPNPSVTVCLPPY
jgi:hypothetical protein